MEVVRCHRGFSSHCYQRPRRREIPFNRFSRNVKSSVNFDSSRQSKSGELTGLAPAFRYRLGCTRSQCFKQPTQSVRWFLSNDCHGQSVERTTERAASRQ
jgi:hypothetical protein